MPPTQRNPDVPADLEQIILTALAKDPDHRYQTADDLRADLLRFRRGRPLVGRARHRARHRGPDAPAPPSARAPSPRPRRCRTRRSRPTDVDGGPPTDDGTAGGRDRALITALVVLGIVVLVGLGIGICGTRRQRRRPGRRSPTSSTSRSRRRRRSSRTTASTVKVERVTNDDVAADIVISQDPAADERPTRAATVTLTVSAGAGHRAGPERRRQVRSRTRNASLEDQGFNVQRQDEAERRRSTPGRVIRTDPAGGRAAPEGLDRRRCSSRPGASRSRSPTSPARTAEAAFTTLGDAGFAVREVDRAEQHASSSGKVITHRSRRPARRRRAARRSRMFVSSGAPQVDVPDVRRADAVPTREATLERRGPRRRA